MTIKDAVAEIIRLKGKDIFKDKKIFFALLGDLAPEYPKELKIIRNNFDEDIFKLFIDENKKNSHKVRLFYSSLDDLGVAEDKIYFFLESFGIPLGWEQEILDFKADSPIQVSNYGQKSTKQSVNENVTDISLNEDILKQWGFIDKKSIPAVLNIPSTYKSPFGTIRITKIDNGVFKDCDKLQSVTIPDTVTEIGEMAFENCTSLEKINIPDSVVKIGDRAFKNCKLLNNINISNSVTEIGNSAFSGCSSLITAVISNKVTKIPEALFINCTSLVNITIPNGVKEIGDFAFADCVALPNILIPKTVTKIGIGSFANCKTLDSIIIPSIVTDIDLRAFVGCEKLQQFTLPTKYVIFKYLNKNIDLKLILALSSAKVGDYVKFGNYPQTLNGDIQPIEWQVLAKENNKMLVISRYGLEAKRFDGSSNNWKNSEIRKWLNSDFYNRAFTDQEKNSISSFNGDNVFLLSKEEAEKYFANNDARKCKATDYAKKNGAYVNNDNGCSRWWLRSPGFNCDNYVCYVNIGGNVNDFDVSLTNYLVRLALWINL